MAYIAAFIVARTKNVLPKMASCDNTTFDGFINYGRKVTKNAILLGFNAVTIYELLKRDFGDFC